MGMVPMLLPPRRNSALFFCPLTQKKTPMPAEMASMRAKMKYSSQPNLAMSSSRVKRVGGTLSGSADASPITVGEDILGMGLL